jgi:hypothetical protein
MRTRKNTRFINIFLILMILGLGQNHLFSQEDFKVRSVRQGSLSDPPVSIQPADPNLIDGSILWMNPVNGSAIDKNTIKRSYDKYWQNRSQGKGSGWKPFKRSEDFWKNRVDENGNVPNILPIFEEYQKKLTSETKKEKTLQENTWQPLGPRNMPEHSSYLDPTGMGRINCVEFNPRNTNVMWAGAAFGGIWRSINAGNTWETFPFTQFMSIGITDIAVAKTSNTFTNIVYAATGDANAAWGGINCYTIGIIKTNDNGETWKLTNFAKQISDRVLINRILVDPRDTNRVYAATTRGLFVTENGGDTWDTLTNAYTRDLEFRPDDPSWLWAAFIYGDGTNTYYGLFRVNVVQREGKDSVAFYRSLDFNYGDVIRMAITVNEKNPPYVYILNAKGNGGLHSVIYTNDGGQQWYYMAQNLDNKIGNYTWDLLNASSDTPDSIKSKSQGFYDLCIAANPANPLDVYIGGVNIHRFRGNNQPWELVAYWTTKYQQQNVQYVHADHHDLRFSPDGVLFSCNDGGINKYNSSSKDWKNLSNGLEVTQFYRIHTSRNDPGLVICGAQDNGTLLLKNNVWNYVRGGDGMDCWIDPFDQQVMYNSIYYGDFAVSRNEGNSFSPLLDTLKTKEKAEWVAPFAIDPVVPDNIFAGYENLWKAGRKGVDPFVKISNFADKDPIRYIAISRANHDVIYVIKPKGIWRTTNAGGEWTQVVTGNGDLGLTSIAIDYKDPLIFWFTRGGFVEDEKVFYYNKGLYKYSEGLPNVPANCIVLNKNSNKNQLFIGTDVGVFFRDNDMQKWEPYGLGLPNVVVQDLDIHEASGKMRAGTFGRGLWEVKIIDCVIDPPEILMNKPNKICDGDSIIISVAGDYVSYEWSTSETSKSITVKETGIYSVIVKDSKGCVATSGDISVTVVKPPNVTIKNAFGINKFCEGDSLKLDAGPSLNFQNFEWFKNDTINLGNGKSYYAKESGTYSAIGITREGCRKLSPGFEVFTIEAPEKPEIIQEENLLTCSVVAKSYSWFFNDQKIAGAINKQYIAKASGNYKVMVTNENDCSNISDSKFIQLVGVEESTLSNLKINLHPNPTNDKLFLEIYDNNSVIYTKSIKIEIRDLLGNVLINIQEHKMLNNEEISIQHLPAGIYLLNIYLGENIFVKKVIKY